MENDQDEVPTAPWWMWLLLIFVASVSFWCQATVTEERFVPALTVIAHKLRIPHDIAGATLMAAGASSPELFSSFVALFITHSSLGLGTIFGSEVFNQLIICAGAVYASETGHLTLNRAVVIRDVSFYALGIGSLYWALRDTAPVDDDPSGIEHVFISFPDALLVFGGYILYVIVFVHMDSIVYLCQQTFHPPNNNTTISSNTNHLEDPTCTLDDAHNGDFYIMKSTAPNGADEEQAVGTKTPTINEPEQHPPMAAAESLIELPSKDESNTIMIVLFYLIFPFRVLIHFTIPDVRTSNNGDNNNTTHESSSSSSLALASLSSAMCLIWLVMGSYAMVASLEALAALLNIPDAVIGYTISAAGTSLPNYVASVVAARNGLGDMAVSNALGSNTFNIMIGLGLPWLLYTSWGTGFEPYHDLRNEGITKGVLILGLVLLLLVVLLLQSGFVLYRWHGHLFVVTYIGYLVYVIGEVYFW